MNVKIVVALFFQVSYPARFCHLRLALLEHLFFSPVPVCEHDITPLSMKNSMQISATVNNIIIIISE
jgi:predicted cobalt transporter CbtA